MPLEWDDELVEIFLEEYREYECLWNPYHASFDDCLARTEALTKIVSALNDRISFKDCLRLLRYVEEQLNQIIRNRSGQGELYCQARWQNIVDTMLEKIVCSEEQQLEPRGKPTLRSRKTVPRIKELFRHTISSSLKQKKDGCIFPSACGCKKKEKKLSRRKKKRKRGKNFKGKLEFRCGCCSNAWKTSDGDCCNNSTMQDCRKPQSPWGQQRDNYLDNLKWSNCGRTDEGPGYASHLDRLSRVENLCTDPCTLPTSYVCPTRSSQYVQCSQRKYEGRKRDPEIQPTMPGERCRSPASSRQSSPCRSRERSTNRCPEPPKKCPPKKLSQAPDSCHCPDKRKTVVDEGTSATKLPIVCGKDTCPKYQPSKPCEDKRTQCDPVPTCPPPCPKKSTYCREKSPNCCERSPVCPERPPALSKKAPSSRDKSSCCCERSPICQDKPSSCRERSPISQNKPSSCRKKSPICPEKGYEPNTNMVPYGDKAMEDCSRNVKFDQQSTSIQPRVAARFENGVLEAYSQFKVVFPSSGTSSGNNSVGNSVSGSASCPPSKRVKTHSQRVQTDKTTRECAVAVSSCEFRPKSSGAKADYCPARCASKRNMQIGTEENVECCQDTDGDLLVPDKNMHDYVLLTPGGKYVPLIKTIECCVDEVRPPMRSEEEPEVYENASMRVHCEKQMQNPLDEEKCGTSTTKLILRCLEQMLNLEEQEEKDKSRSEAKEDPCEPCKRNAQLRREVVQKSSSSECLPCLNEKLAQNNNPAPARGKLTQNFLEVLKCALDLDTKKDDCEDDEQRQDCCECIEADVGKDRQTPSFVEDAYEIYRELCKNDKDKPCKKSEKCRKVMVNKPSQTSSKSYKSTGCQDFLSSTHLSNQMKTTCQDVPLIRINEDPPLSPEDLSKMCTPQNRDAPQRSSRRKVKEATAAICLGPEIQETEERVYSTSKGMQCVERKSRKTRTATTGSMQRRDTVLQYLVKCAAPPDSVEHQPQQQYLKPPKILATSLPKDQSRMSAGAKSELPSSTDYGHSVNYVNQNQPRRSFRILSPSRLDEIRRLKEYHRRICALRQIYNSAEY